MCTNCFFKEIQSFASNYEDAKAAWSTFDLLLTQKLGSGQIVKVKTIATMDFVRSEYFYYIYECRTCGQKWELFEPFVNNENTVYTGYFIRYKPGFWEQLKTSAKRLFKSTSRI
jgi:hypothetical protein